MKKKIIYSSALAVLLSASSVALAGGPEIMPVEPDYFSGFYVGGTGAVHHATLNGSNSQSLVDTNEFGPFGPFDVSVTTPDGTVISGTVGPFGPFSIPVEPGTLASNDADGESIDLYGGVQAGFGKVFNHQWYLGIQGFGEWGTQQQTSVNTDQRPVSATVLGILNWNGQLSVQNTTTVEIQNDYGVAAKLGYVVAPRTMVYGKIGASWADIQVTNTTDANADLNVSVLGTGVQVATANLNLFGSSSNTENKLGLLLGIGFEQFIYQDLVSLNVEYDYVNYGTVSTASSLFAQATVTDVFGNTFVAPVDPIEISNLQTQGSGSATVSSLLAGLNVYFGRDWI